MSASSKPLSYSLDGFAAATGISLSLVKNLVRDGKLTKNYIEGKPVITADEAERYIKSLPTEKRSA